CIYIISLLCIQYIYYLFFFFFQAEDGIRDFHVTGVQTCALPIYKLLDVGTNRGYQTCFLAKEFNPFIIGIDPWGDSIERLMQNRSEERRVGKECRSRWSPDNEKETEREKGCVQ